MRKNQLLSVFSLFLLVPASITRAQTVNLTGTVYIEQDYRVANFSSKYGNVKIILPGDLNVPGNGTAVLSGSVVAEPSGNTEKERADNLAAMQNSKLKIAGKLIPILTGRNLFNFEVPGNLTTPVPIDLEDPMGQRATLSLKNPVVPPAPSTGSLPADQPAIFTDQKVYLTNGNIPVYAANNTSTLFQPTDKFFIRDASGNMTEATKVAQCPTQTVLSSQGIQPGATTIVRQSGNRTDQVNVRMANLTLSASNNNLRNGQTSTVTTTIDPKITDKDSAEAMQIPIMSLNVRNLTPPVIDMAGGNVQVMTFPTTPGSTSQSAWQATRTITGVTPGNFNISATLYPSSSISNNMANTQMQALKTADEFNKWIDAVKQHLANLFSSSIDQTKKDLIRNTINALPQCSSEDELDLCKMMADNLLRSFAIPDLNLATSLPALAAYQAATNSLINPSSINPDFVHTDVIQDGLTYLQNAVSSESDPTIKQNINAAQQATNAVQYDYSPQNINALSAALKKLHAQNNIASFINQLHSNQPDGKNNLPPHTRIARLDPANNLLYINPGDETEVLNSFGAIKQPDGKYLIHCTSYTNKPVTVSVSIVPASLSRLNLGYYSNNDQNIPPIFKNDEKKDNTKKEDKPAVKPSLIDPISPLDPGFEWFPEGKKGEPKPEYSDSYLDSTGVFYDVFIKAKCALVEKAHTVECSPNKRVMENNDTPKFYMEDNMTNDVFGRWNNNKNLFMKLELYDHYNCEAGNDICKAKIILLGVKYIYSDKDCKKLINVMKIIGPSCN
jgi:hypothetical protein